MDALRRSRISRKDKIRNTTIRQQIGKIESIITETTYMVWACAKNGRGTIAQDSIVVDARAEESTRETEEKLDGRSMEGHEREEPARRAVGR
jgi:hypothetical protein